MCDRQHHSGGGHFTSGAVFGVLVGFAIGILTAPSSGKETRKKLENAKDDYKKKALDIAEKTKETYNEVRETAEPILNEMQEKLGPILEKAQEFREPVKEEMLERIQQLFGEDSVKNEKKPAKRRIFKGTKSRTK